MKKIITVPKPCLENWNKMTPTDKGKFCESCNKNVYDFTNNSSSEIIKQLKIEGKICGRIKKEPAKEYSFPYRKIGIFISLASIFSFSNSMHSKTTDIENFTIISNDTKSLSSIKFTNDSITLYGKVFENKLPLPGATVKLKETNIQTTTDMDGNFTIKLPKNIKASDLILEFSYVGMETKEILVKNIEDKIQVELVSNEILIGEVVIYKRSLWDRIFR